MTHATLATGHDVTALVRDPSRLTSAGGLRVFAGDATSRAVVDRTADGQEAMISALGSKSLLNTDIATPAARAFVPAAEARGCTGSW